MKDVFKNINNTIGNSDSEKFSLYNLEKGINIAKNKNDFGLLLETIKNSPYVRDYGNSIKALNQINNALMQTDISIMKYQFGITNIDKETLSKIRVALEKNAPKKYDNKLSNNKDINTINYKFFKLFGIEYFYLNLEIYINNITKKLDGRLLDLVSIEELEFLEIVIILLSVYDDKRIIDELKDLILILQKKISRII
jgi:hypothetical protein